MTKKFTKASVAIAFALFGCSSGGKGSGTPGTAGTSTGAAGSAAGSTGAAGNTGAAGQPTGTAGVGAAGSTGVAGSAAGQAGTAGVGAAGVGAAGATGAGGVVMDTDDVLERGKRPSRDGNYVQPMLTPAAAAKMAMDTAFNTAASFTGQMFSSPLYLAKGPVTGKGIFIAATTNNDVVAFDDTGAMAWKRNIAANPTKAAAGSLTPRGIMGTPVIDSKLGADGFPTIYVCGPAGAGAQDRYELHAISAKDGTERTGGWPAKLDGTIKATNDGLNRAFNPTVEAQRPALSLVNGIVYIGFGGPFGDFGPTYYGWVLSVDTTDPTKIGAWSTRGGGGAVWSPGGFATDGDGIITTTGNNYGGAVPATYMDSEGIIRLSGVPLVKKDAYWPVRWKQMDTDDQDMSSSSVLLLDVPGATPSKYAITESKDAHLYLLDAAHLGTPGAAGGELVDLTLTNSNHSARISPVSYTTSTGIHIAVTVDRGPYIGCPAASTADGSLAALIGMTVSAGSPAKVAINWCTAIGGPSSADGGTVRNRSASPLVTTTDGHSNPILWVAGSASQTATNTPATLLKGIDGETGAVIYSGGNCAGIRQWTTPIAVRGHIVLGGDAKLCSWSPGP